MAAHAAVRGRDDVAAVRRQLEMTRATAAGAGRARPRGRRPQPPPRQAVRRDRSAATHPARAPSPGSGRPDALGPMSRAGARPRRRRSRPTGDSASRARTSPIEQLLLRSAEPRRRPGGEDDGGDHRERTVTWSTTTIRVGVPFGSAASPNVPIRSTTAMPLHDPADDRVVGRERRRCPVITKNCEPAAPGGSVAVLPIATTALDVVGGRPPACRRSCSPGPPCPSASGRRPG